MFPAFEVSRSWNKGRAEGITFDQRGAPNSEPPASVSAGNKISSISGGYIGISEKCFRMNHGHVSMPGPVLRKNVSFRVTL